MPDGLCYTSCGALPGTRNSLMGPLTGINPMTHCTMGSEMRLYGKVSARGTIGCWIDPS